MLVCVSAGHSVAVIHPVYCHRSWFPGSWFLAGSYRSIRPFKPLIIVPGAIVPNHTVRALVTPYSAVYGVSLVSRGLLWWWVSLVACPGVDTAPLVPGGVPPPWCGVGHCLQWGGVYSGYSPTIGVPPLLGGVDSGCFPVLG